jgi:hypothetical protein
LTGILAAEKTVLSVYFPVALFGHRLPFYRDKLHFIYGYELHFISMVMNCDLCVAEIPAGEKMVLSEYFPVASRKMCLSWNVQCFGSRVQGVGR